VDTRGDPIAQGIIHKPVAGYTVFARKYGGHKRHMEVPSAGNCTGMAVVLGAIVTHTDEIQGQGSSESILNFLGRGGKMAHFLSLSFSTSGNSAVANRFIQRACPITNITVNPIDPKSLKLTQASVEKLFATQIFKTAMKTKKTPHAALNFAQAWVGISIFEPISF
jgi:hypothetical protein